MTSINQEILTDIEEPPISHHAEPFYLSAEFWVAIAFFLVVFVIYKPLKKAFQNILTERISRIKQEFEEAETLKLDAQKNYANYERKLLKIEDEINEIIKEENINIEEHKKQKIKELDLLLKQKQREVDGRLEVAYERAGTKINSAITEKTINIIYSIIKTKLTKDVHNKLIDKSIANIEKIDFN